MTIARGPDGLTGQLTGQSPVRLEALGPREFRAVGIDARLAFEKQNALDQP